ncbi:DNA cytosine methyltransferase [Alkaliphilus sp. B6464]|uniref:DNA cytosine methyltransferase n=1 Tax=Alkaliphilus sp. B6464 TaxID=2731219 RepID=UPI001BAC5FD1|nr:DNA cytosine methyltransferase [Alkaliphilus sp. B6464]QUH21253.1 DNA cytosine methyltransferase [Alkaliphilus sp. B6464]
MKYSVLDLFAGCGGFGYGFKTTGDFQINLANDIWKPAQATYVHNNPQVPFILDDIKNLREDIFSEYFPNGVDVIIGGPPCQGFSMCGARDINDERNDLFYEYARIVSYTRPYIFIMENVKGLLSMRNKKGIPVIEAIIDEFDKLGYNIRYTILNSKYYNVPQSRERVIVVGTRNDLPDNYEYPKPQLLENEVFTVGEALEGIPNCDSLNGELYLDNYKIGKYIESVMGSGKIYNHEVPTHNNVVEQRMAFVPQGGNWQDIPEQHRAGGIHSNAYRRLNVNMPSVTIKHAYKSMIIHPEYNRCLSIREVARIQSFNDDYIFKNTKTSQYQQLANAVPPNMAKALAMSVHKYLTTNKLSPINIKNDTSSTYINKTSNSSIQLDLFNTGTN